VTLATQESHTCGSLRCGLTSFEGLRVCTSYSLIPQSNDGFGSYRVVRFFLSSFLAW
jgi:nicotinamide mononucleotide (NMN) deamidase PncC